MTSRHGSGDLRSIAAGLPGGDLQIVWFRLDAWVRQGHVVSAQERERAEVLRDPAAHRAYLGARAATRFIFGGFAGARSRVASLP